jgi:hypothetical protein
MAARKGGGGGGGFERVLMWPAWALALLALGSAFGPLPRDWTQVLRWALTAFGLIEAGAAMAKGRRGAFVAYAAIAVLMNPIRPFQFPVQVWRLLYAGAGLWLAGDHLPRRG